MSSFNFYINWNKKKRYFLSFLLLFILVLLFLGWNLCAGSVEITPKEVLHILRGRETGETAGTIIWQIRFPRVAAAMLLGGALSLSGYLLQTFFQNPIAGPFVLGISSGAKLAVAGIMVLFLEKSIPFNSFTLILAAFAGAMLSMGFLLLITGKISHASMLMIGGVMIGYICSAVTDLIVTFAQDADIVNLHNWSMGSFSGITWENVAVMAGIVLLTGGVVFTLSKPIGACLLGEAYAGNMGVRMKTFRIMLVLLSSILSACVTAFAGPVSFVGIAVPQMMKYLLGTVKPVFMIPVCFLGGAAFCMFCDLLARTLFAPAELSISTVTSIFGAPVVIFAMLRKKKKQRGEI